MMMTIKIMPVKKFEQSSNFVESVNDWFHDNGNVDFRQKQGLILDNSVRYSYAMPF